MATWRMRGAKQQAAAWVRDSGGRFQVAHLIAAEPANELHEPPREDNLYCLGDTPPYTGRLRDLRDASYRLLAFFHGGDLDPAFVRAVGGD